MILRGYLVWLLFDYNEDECMFIVYIIYTCTHHMHTHTHTHTHAYMHAHTHTHTHNHRGTI